MRLGCERGHVHVAKRRLDGGSGLYTHMYGQCRAMESLVDKTHSAASDLCADTLNHARYVNFAISNDSVSYAYRTFLM